MADEALVLDTVGGKVGFCNMRVSLNLKKANKTDQPSSVYSTFNFHLNASWKLWYILYKVLFN